MASPTLRRLEVAASKIVARPMPEVVADLRQIAQNDPTNPTPHLVLAIVTGFAHRQLDEASKHLASAVELLKQGAGQPHDAEWDFSQALSDFLSNELILITRRSQAPLNLAERLQLAQASAESRAALERLEALGPNVKDSPLTDTILAAILAHSQAQGTKTPQYKRGMARLRTLAASQQGVADMAGLFLLYGYRRVRNYTRAVEVGERLVQRNPGSAMPQIALGNAQKFHGRPDLAKPHLEAAVASSPNDPHASLELALVLEQSGQVNDAKDMLAHANSLDLKKDLASFIERANLEISAREHFG